MPVRRRWRVVCLVALLSGLGASSAVASPWTLPEGTAVVTTGTDLQFATDEFLPDGTFQVFPLDGQFFAANLRVGLRYGILDDLEIGGQLLLAHLSYEADEVFFEPPLDQIDDVSDIRTNIASFDQSITGLSDLLLDVSYRMTDPGRVVATLGLQLKLPTGYQEPNGAEDSPNNDLVNDVALGDGQMDATLSVQLGWAPPGGFFLRLDAGARLRMFGPGQQVVGLFKFGRRMTDWWVPYLGTEGYLTITDGDVVGLSFITDSPEVPATEFGPELVRVIDLRLDRSAVRPSIGSIFSIGEIELDLAYSLVVWGENIAQLHAVSVSSSVRF